MSGPPPQAQAPQPPTPEALAVHDFLRHKKELKNRTGILNGKRHEYFKGKHAFALLQSPAYQKAQKKKGSILPEINNRDQAAEALRLLPLHLIALRVDKFADPHAGHGHGAADKKKKRKKGDPRTLSIIREQEISEDHHYAWIREGPQTMAILGSVLLVLVILAGVMFPLWPPTMRLGVWYLSMAMLGVIGLFIVLAIVRLVLFVVTMVVASPGLWLFPNLFEDVGFFESFVPVWGWEKPKKVKGKKKAAVGLGEQKAAVTESKSMSANAAPVNMTARKNMQPRFEEVEE
ncbi:Translocation protein S62 [Saitoella coloradoensis]